MIKFGIYKFTHFIKLSFMATVKKQSVTTKTAQTLAWNTIHIFGHGQSQFIGNGTNKKIANEKLSSIEPLINHLAGIQQKGTKISMDALHTVNIYNEMAIDFHPKPGKNKQQRFAWSDIDKKLVKKLSDDLTKKIASLPVPLTTKEQMKMMQNEVKTRNADMIKKISGPNKRTTIK